MKKKTTIYIFAPLLILVIFVAYYWNFSAGYEAKQEAHAALIRKQHDEKVAADNQLRLKAVNDAIAAQNKRKIEREAKEKKAKEEAAALQAALDTRDHAQTVELQLRDKYERLTREIQDEKIAVQRIDKDKADQAQQLDFLQIQTAQAESNVQRLTAVVNQILTADAAFNAANAAAAAASKK